MKNIHVIEMTADGQNLYTDTAHSRNSPRVIADSVNYLYIRFRFSGEWGGTKFALFYDARETEPFEVRLEDDGCYVPHEVIKAPWFGVSVYSNQRGESGEDTLITTDMKQIYVGASGYAENVLPPVPPPPQSIPVYTPTGARVTQIRTVDGGFEYTGDGETWHRAGGASENVAMPVKVSELENDAGYITLSDVPEMPSRTSELDNDSGFITVDDIPDVADGYTPVKGIDYFDGRDGTDGFSPEITVETEASDKYVLRIKTAAGDTVTPNLKGKNGDSVNMDLSEYATTAEVSGAVTDLTTKIDGKEPAITKKTAFNVDFEENASNILMNGVQSAGVLDTVPRADHTHPVDTSREPAITPKNTAFNVNFETVPANIVMNGTQSVGTSGTVARGDHVHPIDTSRLGKIISQTYAQLKSLKDSSALVPGQAYLLTDYQTKYRIPYVNVIKTIGTVEQLVLIAVSSNQFSPIAASPSYPQDVVYYDFTDNVCEDGSTARNGFIQRRVDTKYYVDMPHDWRNMVWARLKATAQTWTSGAVTRRAMYQDGTNLYMATKTGTPSSATDAKYFQLICTANDYFWTGGMSLAGLTYNTTTYAERYTFNAAINATSTTATKSSTIFPERIVVQGGSLRNDIDLKGLSNNVWQFSSESNKPYNIFVENGFYSNTFRDYGYNYNFGNNCYNNIFSRLFDSSFENTFYNNIFLANVTHSSISNNFFDNLFSSYCQGNKFGGHISRNMFIGYFQYNLIKGNCYDNNFGNYFQYNTLEPFITNKDMSSISELHSKTYHHRIFKNSSEAIYAVHYVGTTPTYTSIP